MQSYNNGHSTVTNVLAHTRLAIVGLDTGAQPLYNESQSIAAVVNGEIYNHKKFRSDKSIVILYN